MRLRPINRRIPDTKYRSLQAGGSFPLMTHEVTPWRRQWRSRACIDSHSVNARCFRALSSCTGSRIHHVGKLPVNCEDDTGDCELYVGSVLKSPPVKHDDRNELTAWEIDSNLHRPTCRLENSPESYRCWTSARIRTLCIYFSAAIPSRLLLWDKSQTGTANTIFVC